MAARNPEFVSSLLSLLAGTNLETFLRTHYRYRDEREEIVRTPEWMLNDLTRLGYIEGDCDDISTLAAASLLAIGWPEIRLVAIIYTPGKTVFEHVFVEFMNSGAWEPMDITTAPGVAPYALRRMVQGV
jgi:hypothetical protein